MSRSIPEVLRSARMSLGLSQSRLAESLGFYQSQISNIEAGANVRISTLVNVTRYLGFELVPVPRRYLNDVLSLIGERASGSTVRRPLYALGGVMDDDSEDIFEGT